MIDIEFKVRRYIAEFSEEIRDLLAEYHFSFFDLRRFKVEYGESNTENLMFDCFPVSDKSVEFLKKYIVK